MALLVAVSEKKAQAAFPGHNGKIAYTEYDSYPDEDREIYTMNPDSTDRKQLTDNSANEFAPDLSLDGKRIAFVKKDDVWVMDADGSNRKNLTKTAPVNGYGVIRETPPTRRTVPRYPSTCRPSVRATQTSTR